MDWNGVAKAVSDALGREVIYEPIEIADFRSRLQSSDYPSKPFNIFAPSHWTFRPDCSLERTM
jgi:hypothetical protein